ncbi:cytochrome b/b6 domain-containing protein [Candidatus Pelagibacter sp.]|nr:cytochrome b/b6 domain-containing protein [Candidatus Pelagibacter bacterium]MDB3943666.1 cytochrome b/b6 domain-containing protein [Candidatus Pelagibacter sp.]MDC1126157.1 cytochrome b/b6 domain-containing protein [Candidatus Pelagibacter sp.]
MHVKNTLTEYGLISKSLHWLSAILLFIQIPLGFYLVDLDFGPERLTVEDIHVAVGLSIFYLVILRLLNNLLNPTPKLEPSVFKGQKFLAKLNHVLLYVTILSITISGIFKKLFNGETLTIVFKKIKIQDNFELGELFYDIHVISNYILIALIIIHILAVITHRLFFSDNLLKRML